MLQRHQLGQVGRSVSYLEQVWQEVVTMVTLGEADWLVTVTDVGLLGGAAQVQRAARRFGQLLTGW